MRFPFRPRSIDRSGDDSPTTNVFRYVWRMSGHHQAWICLLALAVAALGVAPLELQRRIVDGVLEDRGDLDLLWLLCGIYLAVVLLQAFGKYALRLYQSWLAESAIRYTRAHLARLYECRVESRGERRDGDHDGDEGNGSDGGQAVSIIGAEVEKLGGFVGDGLSQPAVNAGMLLAVMAYMLAIQPLIAVATLPFLLPLLVVLPLIQVRINRLLKRRLKALREMGQEIADADGSDPEGFEALLHPQLDRVFRLRIRLSLLKFAAKGLINLCNNLAPIAILLIGGMMVLEGSSTVGTIVAFVSGFHRMTDPARELLNYYRLASQAEVQHRMIAKWM